MRTIMLLLLLPFSCFSQDQNFAENNCEAWIKIRMKDDSSTYKSIFFSTLEPNYIISKEGTDQINRIIIKKYGLFTSGLTSNTAKEEYKEEIKLLDQTIKNLQEQYEIIFGFTMKHKFVAKAENGCLVNYDVTYNLNDQLEVFQAKTRRKIDCGNTNY